jgi:fructuronate reductase
MTDRARVRLAHLGLGAFHRAHQAWYTQRANAGESEPWGIAAFTGRRPDAARALTALDCRYDLVTRGADGDRAETIDAIVEAVDGADAARWREVVSEVAVITVTVTEAGYDIGDDDRADRREGRFPASAIGRLVDGLAARRDAEGGPIAIVACDNLDGNGELLRTRVAELAGDEPALASWIDENVSFVSSVVDRITPAVVAETEGAASAPGAVVAEPAASWTLAGDFPAGRPAWEKAGARFVDDIAPYERRKLWLLNAGHTLLATLGSVRGLESVAEAMADTRCREALDALWDDAAEVLPFSADEIAAERASLTARFENARIRHALQQIALDSDLKLRVRVIPVIAERRRRGLAPGRGELTAIAAWAAAVAAGRVAGPELPDDAHEAAEAALAHLSPELAADDVVALELAAAVRALEPLGVSR